MDAEQPGDGDFRLVPFHTQSVNVLPLQNVKDIKKNKVLPDIEPKSVPQL